MINTLKLNIKCVGSFALRCGCSHYGIRVIGNFQPLVQVVFIFKNKDKALNFKGWLNDNGLKFDVDYTFQHRYYKGQFIYLIFFNTLLFYKGVLKKVGQWVIEINKFYFSNFPQFCKQNIIGVYNSDQTRLYDNNRTW